MNALSDKDAFKAARAAYSTDPPKEIGQWQLVSQTPTIKCYRNANQILLAIRGTDPSDTRDLKAEQASCGMVSAGLSDSRSTFKR
jgi:hypothetical protein